MVSGFKDKVVSFYLVVDTRLFEPFVRIFGTIVKPKSPGKTVLYNAFS